ncbi:universal stress protein [Actinomadura parmotrematis]|uniref:Universal stress protein n=1 Tax=Actinomadura parmotrematis TaxID=2864039 RepID=A0ABS7FSA9_9ACTN|nr:universal stress protein [Actinomadura parmotrematis]MBW8483288.1 universal stress protein [Actinomadura parmotrematis]
MDNLNILVGYSPDDRGDDALTLAALVARTAGSSLTIAHVRPPAWPTRGAGSVDAEWVAYLKEQSEEALRQARDRLKELKVPARRADFQMYSHRGSGRGLIAAAEEIGAGLIIVGSAPRGRRDRVAIGSTADQLLHGSPAPVMMAPRGFAESAPKKFERLTIAYWRRREVEGPLLRSAQYAQSLGVPVRLVTMVLRPAGLPARFLRSHDVVERQVEQAEKDLAYAARLLGPSARESGLELTTETAVGAGIAKTLGGLDIGEGEILALMSSHEGPLRKVFLGERSGKIVRAAPCPVIVLPRGLTSR